MVAFVVVWAHTSVVSASSVTGCCGKRVELAKSTDGVRPPLRTSHGHAHDRKVFAFAVAAGAPMAAEHVQMPLPEHSGIGARVINLLPIRHPAVRLIASTAVQALLQSAFALLTARWLGPTDRGVLTLAVSTSSLAMLIGSMGLMTGARVILASPQWAPAWCEYWRVVMAVTLAHTLTITAIAAACFYLLARGPSLTTVAAFSGYCALMVPASLGREGLHGVGRHIRATLTDVYAATIQLVLASVLYLAHGLTVSAVLVCGCIGFIAQIFISRWCGPRTELRHRFSLPAVTNLALRMIVFSAPGMVLVLGQVIAWKGDRLILGAFGPPRAVGVYAVGATIADAAWMLPTAVSVIVLRKVAATGTMRPLRKWRGPILGTTAATSLLLAILVPLFIHSLLGPGYAGSVKIVWILCFASLLFASQQVDLAACNGAHRLDIGARVGLCGAGTLILFSFALIPHFMGVGAAIASVVAYLVMAVLARRASLRLTRELDGPQPTH